MVISSQMGRKALRAKCEFATNVSTGRLRRAETGSAILGGMSLFLQILLNQVWASEASNGWFEKTVDEESIIRGILTLRCFIREK